MKVPVQYLLKPFLLGLAAFAGVISITLIIAHQQLEFENKKDQEDLTRELSYVKDRFRNILYSDITAANAMGIIYKEYGTPKNFDSIAAQIIRNNRYAEVLQLTVNGVITNVYPINGYEKTIGVNTLADSTRIQEAKRATEKKEIFFAGPRPLRMGGAGILGKVPIVINNQSNALCVVLTKMETISKAMGFDASPQNKFACELVKRSPGSDTTHYFLTQAHPTSKLSPATTDISEGDWRLEVSYNTTYRGNSFPPVTCVLGGLLAVIIGMSTFRMTKRPHKLQEIIATKTHALGERIKELSTIYQVSRILQDEEQRKEEALDRIVNVLPPGWQYPDVCEARIVLDDKEFKTQGYRESPYSQVAEFKTGNGTKGFIEVIYTEEKKQEDEGVFLREERDLINTLAEMVQVYLDKKVQQSSLIHSEANLKSIFDNTAVSYLLLDADNNVLALNQLFVNGWFDQTGTTLKPGSDFLDKARPESLPRIKAAIDKVKSTQLPLSYETHFDDGQTIRHFDVLVSPVITHNEVIRIIFSVVNITERKNMENERQRMLVERQVIIDDLTKRNRDLEQFSYIVSHNVRGPLATILGLSRMAGDEKFDTSTKIKAIEGIEKASGNLDSVLHDLSEILQVRRELSEKRTQVDLNELVRTTRETLGKMIIDSKAVIHTDFTQVPVFPSIKSYMQNIIYNMITNSIKYARPGVNPHIEIRTEKKGENILLHFRDNGIGIDLEKHGDSLFGLYKRFNFTVEGKGLGLYMAKTQTEALNGTIAVESRLNEGTQFVLTFRMD